MVTKPSLPEFLRCFGRRHDWQRLVKFPLGHLVKVIPVEVRENYEIQGWQIVNLDGWVCQTCTVHPIPNRNLLMHVDEDRIG
jgi:hypothetical protein